MMMNMQCVLLALTQPPLRSLCLLRARSRSDEGVELGVARGVEMARLFAEEAESVGPRRAARLLFLLLGRALFGLFGDAGWRQRCSVNVKTRGVGDVAVCAPLRPVPHTPSASGNSLYSPPSAHSSPRENACVPASNVARKALRRPWCSVTGEARGVVVADEDADETRGMAMNVIVEGGGWGAKRSRGAGSVWACIYLGESR